MTSVLAFAVTAAVILTASYFIGRMKPSRAKRILQISWMILLAMLLLIVSFGMFQPAAVVSWNVT